MRKTLTLMLSLATSATLFAQSPVQFSTSAAKMQKMARPAVKAEKFSGISFAKANNPLRSAETGNYYYRPAGSMYEAFKPDRSGYYGGIVIVSPFVNAVFENQNTDPSSAKWSFNGQDASQYIDANGDFPFGELNPSFLTSDYSYSVPVITKGQEAWEIENYYKVEGQTTAGFGFSTDSIGYLTLADMHVNGSQLTFGYSSFNSDKYLFGSGKLSFGDGSTFTSDGVSQHFDAPMAPLYVEDIYFNAYTFNGVAEPIKNANTVITLQIIGDDGSTIATLTAGKDDLVKDGEAFDDANVGKVQAYVMTFVKKEKDPISGGEVVSPFVINQGFTIKITGFSQDGVNFGFGAYVPAPEDRPMEKGLFILKEEGAPTDATFSDNITLPVNFHAMFEKVQVPASLSDNQGNKLENTNVVRISEDGTTSSVEGQDPKVVPGLFIYTATPWFDENENSNYTYQVLKSSDGGDGDWITSLNIDPSYYYQQNSQGETVPTGLNLGQFEGDAVDAGKGRWAIVEVLGRGNVPADNPVIVLQGTAKLSDVDLTGIQDITSGSVKNNPNAPVYNVAGQRVAKNAKGLLIQNGRKFINK